MRPKFTPAQRRAATNALDAWVLGLVAQKCRESVSRDVAFSAFLSEVAGDPYLSKMEYAKVVRVRPWRA